MDPKAELAILRKEIDSLDTRVIELLAKRRNLVLKVGRTKKRLGVAIFDHKREQFLLDRIKRKGKKRGLNPGFIEALFRLIVSNSKETQYHAAL